jgi:hypothetical protein
MERRGLQTPAKGKSPLTRRRRPSRPTPRVFRIGRPLGGVKSVKYHKKGQRDRQVQSGVNRVGRAASWKEGEKPSCEAKTAKSANSQSVPYRTASGRSEKWKMQQKVNATDKFNQV